MDIKRDKDADAMSVSAKRSPTSAFGNLSYKEEPAEKMGFSGTDEYGNPILGQRAKRIDYAELAHPHDDELRRLGVDDKALVADIPRDKTAKEDRTYGGGRELGDSGALARNIFEERHKGSSLTFKEWKMGREAQHLIPAGVAKRYQFSSQLMDSADNGMMLPGRGFSRGQSNVDENDSPVLHRKLEKYKDLNRPVHVRPVINGKENLFHNQYNKAVAGAMKELTDKHGRNKEVYLGVMSALRLAHKGTGLQYVDDIDKKRIVKCFREVYKK